MNLDFWKNKLVLVTGATGFVGQNLVDYLKDNKVDYYGPTHREYDLTNESDVERLFACVRPNIVFHLAGEVGGIYANSTRPADFFYKNLMMGALIFEYAYKFEVEKLIALAAGCGYPENAVPPFLEDDFWSGLPEKNTRAYSMAKKNLILQGWAYREQYGFNSSILLPANLYGCYDNFNLETSHVVPALIRKFINAANENTDVVVWGSGAASREFLYVKDAVLAMAKVAENYNNVGPLNLGTGVETTIKELIELISILTNFCGKIIWDVTKPDGQKRRVYDMSKFQKEIGYIPSTLLKDGLSETIEWYKKYYVCR